MYWKIGWRNLDVVGKEYRWKYERRLGKLRSVNVSLIGVIEESGENGGGIW